jgi:hypothetical protein
MSAVSENTAFISLGMSCQSASQIRKGAEVMSEALGETVEPDRHFFDGLISPVAGLAQLFEDGFPMFDRAALERDPDHPVWKPYGLRFLHHFRGEDGIPDIDRYYSEDLSRFSYLREKFLSLVETPRIVFVISNSQNNLDQVADETGLERLDFDNAELDRLQSAVDGFFGRPHEYLVVSHWQRHGGIRRPDMWILDADDSDWNGDKSQWRALFAEYLSSAPADS